ncbi:MAG: protein kinase, partial [Streptosporangiaceae bacterium]
MSQPTLEPLRRWDPDRIGPYSLIGRLGAGAMGQVYLGRSTAGRLVAVKTIKIEMAEEPGFRLRFAREVAAARRVSGVFTAAVVAADPEAEMPWLATAYVPAPSLSRLVRVCGPLPVPAVRWLAAGCAEALESIHLAGLVHRDLKPSNVLVAPDGPRVIDFGLARAAERIQLTATRGAVGTPAYMAPEQARDSQHASLASDVYSLGATLLFAATGHGPYQGETVMDVLVKLATEAPDLSGLPADLTTLVEACLERSPRMRPTSAGLLAGLGSFVEATADPADAHYYLPDSAMALIGEYQRSPQPAVVPRAGPEPDSEDPTSASHTALPASFTPPASHRRRRQASPRKGANGTALAPASRSHGPRRPRARAALIASGVVVGAAVLAIGGAYVGPKIDPGLSGPSASATASILDPPPGAVPPETPAHGTSTTPKL